MLGRSPAGAGVSIREWSRRQAPVSQVVIHNTAAENVYVGSPSSATADGTWSQLARDVYVAPGATLGRLELRRSVTTTGFDLDAECKAKVDAFRLDMTGTQSPR